MTMGACACTSVWYRRWEPVVVLSLPDGRVVEYDSDNALHVIAVAKGMKPAAPRGRAHVRVVLDGPAQAL
jgi:hypothetical protein